MLFFLIARPDQEKIPLCVLSALAVQSLSNRPLVPIRGAALKTQRAQRESFGCFPQERPESNQQNSGYRLSNANLTGVMNSTSRSSLAPQGRWFSFAVISRQTEKIQILASFVYPVAPEDGTGAP